jgi:hypothetical protein
MSAPQRIIVREADGLYKIVIKESIDLSNYEYVGMKQFGKDLLEEYHAK